MPNIARDRFEPHRNSSFNSNNTIPSRVIPCIKPDVQGTALDGETVVLHLTSGQYYTLNRVGTAIWDLCTGENTLQDIHAALCARFEVSPDRAEDDLMTLVTLLEGKGLVELTNS